MMSESHRKYALDNLVGDRTIGTPLDLIFG